MISRNKHIMFNKINTITNNPSLSTMEKFKKLLTEMDDQLKDTTIDSKIQKIKNTLKYIFIDKSDTLNITIVPEITKLKHDLNSTSIYGTLLPLDQNSFCALVYLINFLYPQELFSFSTNATNGKVNFADGKLNFDTLKTKIRDLAKELAFSFKIDRLLEEYQNTIRIVNHQMEFLLKIGNTNELYTHNINNKYINIKFSKLLAHNLNTQDTKAFNHSAKYANTVNYTSTTGSRETLNGAALDSDGNPILCRHLAYEFLVLASKDHKNKTSNTYQTSFKDTNSIAKNENLSNRVYDKYKIAKKANSYAYVSLNNIGQYFNDICSEMKFGDIKFIILNSYVHAMALTIKYKNLNTYAVKFYDPNHTKNHEVVITENLRHLDLYSMENFAAVEYFVGDDLAPAVVKLMIYDNPELNMENIPYSNLDWNTKYVDKNSTLLYFYLINNDIVKFSQEVDRILQLEITPKYKIFLLEAYSPNGASILYSALKRGYTEMIECFTTKILESNLESGIKDKILLNTIINTSERKFAIDTAIKRKHLESTIKFISIISKTTIAKDYAALIINSNHLTWADKAILLPEFSQIEKLIEEFKKILNSDIKITDKIKLLQTKDSNGKTWLYQAIRYGRTKVAISFILTVFDSDFAAKHISDILLAKIPKQDKHSEAIDQFALNEARKYGCSNTADEVMSLIMKTKKLDLPNKAKLIPELNYAQALYSFLAMNCIRMIEPVTMKILDSGLTAEQIYEILLLSGITPEAIDIDTIIHARGYSKIRAIEKFHMLIKKNKKLTKLLLSTRI